MCFFNMPPTRTIIVSPPPNNKENNNKQKNQLISGEGGWCVCAVGAVTTTTGL